MAQIANKTRIPNNLIDSLVHGLELAASVVDLGDMDAQGRDLYLLAHNWSALGDNLRWSPFIREDEAAEIRAVIVEAAEYAETCNYGDEADEEDFPGDVKFAREAKELLSFLELASVPMQ